MSPLNGAWVFFRTTDHFYKYVAPNGAGLQLARTDVRGYGKRVAQSRLIAYFEAASKPKIQNFSPILDIGFRNPFRTPKSEI